MKKLLLILPAFFALVFTLQAQTSAYTPYTVKTGDTFYRLTKVFEIGLDDLKKANPHIHGNNLNAGQVINIPATAKKAPAQNTAAATNSQPVVVWHNDAMTNANADLLPMKESGVNYEEPIARAVSDIIAQKPLPEADGSYPTLAETPKVLSITQAPPMQDNTQPAAQPVPFAVVQPTPTAEPVQQKTLYAVIVNEANANTGSAARSITTTNPNPNPNPTAAPQQTQTAGQNNGAAVAAPPQNTPITNLKPLKHRVREKETLYSLAQYYGKSVAVLQNWNTLPDINIQKGQEIIVDWIMPSGEALTALELAAALGAGSAVKPAMHKFQAEFTKFETDTLGMYKPTSHEGMATWFDDSGEKSSVDNMYCLHRYAPLHSIVKVTNPINKRTAHLMVIGKLPSTPENDNVLISVTQTAAKKLALYGDKLRVNTKYYTPR